MKNVGTYIIVGIILLALFLSAFFLTIFVTNPSNKGFSMNERYIEPVEYCDLNNRGESLSLDLI